ncbi:HNH endonuclease [Alsobacter sp. R-9]
MSSPTAWQHWAPTRPRALSAFSCVMKGVFVRSAAPIRNPREAPMREAPHRRRSLSTRERLDLFIAANGRCQRCGWALRPGTRWDVDHVIPLALGGRDTPDNMQVLCVPCHSGKTRRQDVPTIAKIARVRARHLGAARARRPMPGGKDSKWKRTIDGRVVERR